MDKNTSTMSQIVIHGIKPNNIEKQKNSPLKVFNV